MSFVKLSDNREAQIYQKQKLIQNYDVQIPRNWCSNPENFSLEPIFSHLNQYLSVLSVLDCVFASFGQPCTFGYLHYLILVITLLYSSVSKTYADADQALES